VEQVSFKNDTGVYAVTLPETSKFDSAAVKKAVGSFKLERVDLKIAGEVSKDDRGVWLTAPSGTKLLLANRPKKDEKDAPPDILAKIEEGLKAGKTTFSVAGSVKEEKDSTTVQLDSAEAVEKEKKEGR
jgi:hypothetical protein